MSAPDDPRPEPPVTPSSELAAAELELDAVAGTDVETQPERYGAAYRHLQAALADAEPSTDRPSR